MSGNQTANYNSISPEYTRFITGGIAGITEVTLTHPIDLLKTKVQEAKLKGRPIHNPMKYISRRFTKCGLLGIYKGYIPRLLGVVPMRFIFWGTQNNCNYYLSKNTSISHGSSLILSGVVGGAAQTIVDNPIEAMKTRMMTGKDGFSSNLKKRSFPGFFPTLYRNIGFAAVFNYCLNYSQSDGVLINTLKAGASGFMASIVTQPLDYIKTECQRDGGKPDSIWRITKKCLIRNPAEMMAGTMPRAILGFCNMGVGGMTIYTLNKFLFQ